MKCQEVMMYMQRQLDGDLTPNEEDELHAHLMHCLDCAEMFERLQALSDELSQLPKVMPPFSLVDAILPQLLEMDKQNGSSVTDNIVNFPPVVSRSAESVKEPKRSSMSRFKEQFSWKIASGVVAAGLIIGFFAFNMQHPLLDNADGLLSRTSSDSKSASEKQATAAAGSVQGLTSKETANEQDADGLKNSDSNAPTADTFTKGQGPAAAASSTRSGTGAGTTGTMPQATASANLEKPGAYSPPPAGNDAQSTQIAPSTSPPARIRGNDTSEKADQNAEGVTPKASLAVPQSSIEPKTTGTPTSKLTPSPSVDPTSTDRITASQGNFSLSRVAAELKSTTGIYQAVIEEAHVVIRNSQTQEIVFASKRVWQADDQIRLLEWSKDDKLFYEVTSKGTLQTILIDLNEKTEANK
jgi:hypothetical protein